MEVRVARCIAPRMVRHLRFGRQADHSGLALDLYLGQSEVRCEGPRDGWGEDGLVTRKSFAAAMGTILLLAAGCSGDAPTEAEAGGTERPSASSAPSPSSSPTEAFPAPVTEADELRIAGLGPMTIGMHVNDVERATGMEVDVSSDFSPQCRYGRLVGGPQDLFLMFSRRVLVRIDIGTESVIKTDTGIGVGDPISKVEDAYGDELQSEPHPYLGDRGSYLIFDPEPEDGLLMIFETDRHSVTSFRSGFDEQVRYIEGCA